VLLGNTFDVSSLAFSPDDRRLASGGRDGTVRIWDPLRGELVLTLRHEPAVVDLAWSPDGRQLAALDSDLELRIWDARRSREQREGRDSR
jgi:WD40 repeat protein